MESLGVSLEDATNVMTVSKAFRKAQTTKGSTIGAIDELTSRLCLAKLSRKEESSTTSSPSAHSFVHSTQNERDSSVDHCYTHPALSSSATLPQKSQRSSLVLEGEKGEKQKSYLTIGRKRALFEKSVSEICVSEVDVRFDEPQTAVIGVKEIINAKMSKDEKNPVIASSSRNRSSASSGARSKRVSSLHAEDPQPIKRPRTASDDICPSI